jgi:hypothetical protein
LGSYACAGAFDGERPDPRDHDGVTLREAVCSFGGDPDAPHVGAGPGEGATMPMAPSVEDPVGAPVAH